MGNELNCIIALEYLAYEEHDQVELIRHCHY